MARSSNLETGLVCFMWPREQFTIPELVDIGAAAHRRLSASQKKAIDFYRTRAEAGIEIGKSQLFAPEALFPRLVLRADHLPRVKYIA